MPRLFRMQTLEHLDSNGYIFNGATANLGGLLAMDLLTAQAAFYI